MDYTIRKATPDDAGQLITRLQHLLEEPGINFLLGPGEFNVTVEQERAWLQERLDSDNSVFLVADCGGRIIGNVGCDGGKRAAVRHVGTLGVSVDADWRGRGVGSAMMQAVVDWARGTGVLRRLQLDVFCRNEAAVALYRKFGFEVEGCRRQAILREGVYLDDYVMGLLL